MKISTTVGLFSLALAACNTAGVSSNAGRLQANADAQHAGVYAYAVDGDTVTLFDQNGIESARVTVTSPSNEGRHFALEAVDGTTDEADVGRPLPDGSFFAPITPETMLTAAMADKALAAHWAAYQLTFTLNLAPRLAAGSVRPEDTANTTTCTSYACGQTCSPAGCAKPANWTVGCTNPSQLPATWSNDGTSIDVSGQSTSQTACQTACRNLGLDFVGWEPEIAECDCGHRYSSNSWVASCPPSVCSAPNYDAVPRNGSCIDPGSCTYSQGSVGCTPYH